MQTETHYGHIVLNDAGVPIIAGTTMKVVELVLDHLAYRWSPEALQVQHPYLSMGQIHAALAYYWDNKEELDAKIQSDLEEVDKLRESFQEPSLVKRLKEKRLI